VPAIDLLVHATHEAGLKLGGIGAVLDGLLSNPVYNADVKRTVLVGPWYPTDATAMERLTTTRNRLAILYSSLHGIDRLTGELPYALFAIEQHYKCRIMYGRRSFGDYSHEVLLVSPWPSVGYMVDEFKGGLYRRFGVDSQRYEKYDEYNAYIAAAMPSYAALQCLVGTPLPPPAIGWPMQGRAYILAHEWLGLPLVYAAMLLQRDAYKTVFYAHEVATVRPLVEFHEGHDTRFYNVMRAALDEGLTLEDVFGDQSDFFKHALVRAAWGCDGVFAVGDLVVEELRFLQPGYRQRNIDLVPNGVPSAQTSLDDKRGSRHQLQTYAQALLGVWPDYIFTHVTRLVPSKALWRDIRVLEHLEYILRANGKTAVLFVVSSAPPAGRTSDAAWAMEAHYGWPANHRVGWPDLVNDEIAFWQAAQDFNRRSRATNIIFVNQFGWTRERVGQRMPSDMEFIDLRRGTDVEFGQSIYEPFGISQLEPLGFGGLCAVSNVCGCVGFVRRAGGMQLPNIAVADYVTLPDWLRPRIGNLLNIGRWERDQIETAESERVALKLASRLPTSADEMARLIDDGAALAERMSWDVVTRDYLLPGLSRL
jgi:hypothetical protein